MHQRKYALELISEVGLAAAKPAITLIDVNIKLTSKQYNDSIDIAFGVQTLSQFLQQPKRSHMEAALRIVKYVKSQPGQGILLSSTRNNTITAFWDADWAACPLTRKSVTRFLVKFVTP
ncbi:PREDICTED: uncharacterized protein LOC109221285 [Nicotiana attenuata]|uniref:uncharacterized protein LOC109221285 n=1 Tax=Nicotiana attenuata TaxID=49451 RepID=UPI000905869D|nr:PREDICTED: uncharacterized protein LOC109221285 [Nicotiana attenuata]